MEIKFTNYQFNEKEINFTIENKTITGITGTSLEDYIDLFLQKKQGKGAITINGEKLTKEIVDPRAIANKSSRVIIILCLERKKWSKARQI